MSSFMSWPALPTAFHSTAIISTILQPRQIFLNIPYVFYNDKKGVAGGWSLGAEQSIEDAPYLLGILDRSGPKRFFPRASSC